MEITQFVSETSKGPIGLDVLTTIAATRAAHGADVEAGFRTQVELRSAAAQAVLDTAEKAGRDSLLASEQREYDRHIRERDAILALQRSVEARTAHQQYVPPAAVTTRTETAELSPVVTRDGKVAEHIERRGGYVYQGERGVEALSFGRVVRAWALGNRAGLSTLERRALEEGTDSSGGYTVPEVLAGRFIDRVRNAMVVMRAGAVTVPMQSDNLNIARLAQPTSVSPAITTATWKTENELITETDLVLERVRFVARTLPVMLKLSVELSEDSVNVDQIIEAELAAQLALELDRVALLGSGSAPEPRGIRNQSGVNVQDLAAVTIDDYDFLIDAIGRVWAQNHEPGARIYNSSLATKIAKFKSSADSQPLRVPDVVAAVPAFRTNQIPNDGVSPDTSSLFLGDFTQLLIGLRTSFRLESTRLAAGSFERLQIAVRAYLRADVQLAHPEAFDVGINVSI